MTALYDRALAPTGLRLTQYSLLSTLRRLAGSEGLPVAALADALDMDRTTLTRNLRPLAARGFVVLAGDAADARVRRVVLRPAGAAALEAARPFWRAAQVQVDATIGAADVGALHDWLDRITPAFRAAGGGGDAEERTA
jgi:DNA-binding MarR family transcriptional regulator